MLKQSFTAENFRKIFDYENRKGENLEGEFFPDIAEISKDLKVCKQNLRALKKKKATLSEDEYQEEQTKIREERSDLKKKREDALTGSLNGLISILRKNWTPRKVVRYINSRA